MAIVRGVALQELGNLSRTFSTFPLLLNPDIDLNISLAASIETSFSWDGISLSSMTLVALVAILGAKKKISSNWNLRNLYITNQHFSKIKYQLNEINYELYLIFNWNENLNNKEK